MVIRLNKKNSRWLALAIIVGFFALAQIFTNTNKASIKKITQSDELVNNTNATPSPNSSDNSKFELKNFRRSSNKDGKKLWEIVAERGTYDPDKNISKLYSPNLELFKEGDKSYIIKSDSADIELDGSELKNANLHGKVKATLDNDTDLSTESAIFDYSNNKITSTAPVLIENKLLKINADNFEFDTNTQILVLKGNLKTFIKAKNEKK